MLAMRFESEEIKVADLEDAAQVGRLGKRRDVHHEDFRKGRDRRRGRAGSAGQVMAHREIGVGWCMP